MADPVSAGLIIGAVGTAGSIYFTSQGADAQEEQYRQRAHQERVAAQLRTVQRQKSLIETLSTQRANAGARGIQSSSESFKAIEQGEFQQFDQDENADALTTAYGQQNIESQIQTSRLAANAQMFSSLMNFGSSAFNINRSKA